MDYLRDGDDVYIRAPLKDGGEARLAVVAREIEQERGQTKARVSIWLDGHLLFWTTDSVEKDENRVRMANSAHKMFRTADKEEMSDRQLKHVLDEFCLGLWDEKLRQEAAEMMEGDSTVAAIEFVLQPYIVKGGGTILYAPPGRGKSFIGQIAAVCVDAGLNGLWHIMQTPVLFVNLERSRSSVSRRLSAVNAALGLPRTRSLLTINRRGHSMLDVYDAAERAVAEHGVGLVVLDSLSRGGFGDLTENQPVNRAIDALNKLCPSWLALAHTPRADESHVFGGVHHEAGADVMVQLTTQANEDELGIGLEITKANDTRVGQRGYYSLSFTENGLSGVRMAERWEFPTLGASKPDMAEAIIEFLHDQENSRATATDIAQELSYNRVNVATLLNHDKRFVKLGRVGKKVYFGVKSHMDSVGVRL